MFFVLFLFLQLLHRSANGTLSPMPGISPSLYPPIPKDSQRTATTPGTSCPACGRVVRAPDLKPEFKSRCDHRPGSLWFNSSAALVHSQLVCLLLVWDSQPF